MIFSDAIENSLSILWWFKTHTDVSVNGNENSLVGWEMDKRLVFPATIHDIAYVIRLRDEKNYSIGSRRFLSVKRV